MTRQKPVMPQETAAFPSPGNPSMLWEDAPILVSRRRGHSPSCRRRDPEFKISNRGEMTMIRTAIAAAASLALLAAATPGFAQDYGYGYRYGYNHGYGIVQKDYSSQYSTYHPWAPQYDSYNSYKNSWSYDGGRKYGYSRYGYGYKRCSYNCY
jgi:hypothetical protein